MSTTGRPARSPVRRRLVLGLFAAAILLAAVLAADLPQRVVPGGEASDRAPSSRVTAATEHLNLPTLFVVARADRGQVSPAARQLLLARLRTEPDVRTASELPPSAGRPDIAVVQVVTGTTSDQTMQVAARLQDDQRRLTPPGTTLAVGGWDAYRSEITQRSFDDLRRAEAFGIPAVLLVLFLTFGSLWGALVAAFVGLSAVLIGLGAVDLVGRGMALSEYVENAATMIGVALGVDYGMFLVQRVREEAATGFDVPTAVTRAMRTTGRSVLWSGVVVILAESSLLLVDSRAVHSIAIGLMLVTASALLTTMFVTPLLIEWLGERVLRSIWKPRTATQPTIWSRWARVVLRRPMQTAASAAVVLLACALPTLHVARAVHLSFPESLPATSSTMTAYRWAADAYGPGAASPVVVLLPRTDVGRAGPAARALAADPDVTSVRPLNAGSGGTALLVTDRAAAFTPAANRLVERIRSGRITRAVVHEPLLVGGETAAGLDYRATMSNGVRRVLLALLPLTALLFLLALGFPVLAGKAVALVALSLGASFGVLVLLTTTSTGSHLIGQSGPAGLNPIVPVIVIALVIALTTDYEVVLIGRIREEHERSGDLTSAIRTGLTATGRVITSAAAVMIVIFGTFATADVLPAKQVGVGLMVAVLVDATLIRAMLLPATMSLLGTWNWWLPHRSARGTRATATAGSVPEPRRGALSDPLSQPVRHPAAH